MATWMSKYGVQLLGVCAGLGLTAWGCSQSNATKGDQPIKASAAAAPAAASAEHGRYVVMTGGCNDCHTPGFMQAGMAVPESLWFTGAPVGWRGPWGTTYASNLRLFVKDMDEQTFVAVARARNDRPPMPWPSLHAMSDEDLRSVHMYLKKLGPAGQPMPTALPPGEEPKTPWLDMSVHLPKGAAPSGAEKAG